MLTTVHIFVFSVLVPLLYSVCFVPYAPERFGQLTVKGDDSLRVLLLTAHPDDECMFFAPTLLGLGRLSRNESRTTILVSSPRKLNGTLDHLEKGTREDDHGMFELYSLCLSSGDADGLGEVRKRELEGSLDVLGIPAGKRWVLDSPFKDDITEYWNSELVSRYVKEYVLKYDINLILTFDNYGISSHPNHISLHHGITVLLSDLKDTHPIRAFALETSKLIPKYLGQTSAFWAKVNLVACALFSDGLVGGSCNARKSMTFVSGLEGYMTALRAMKRHWSQLVWFRWLYVSFSRYMWVNEWVEIGAEAS